jgi:hypothetical protein
VPSYTWPLSFNELADITNAWPEKEAGGLLHWAVWAADGMHYLLELDDRAFGSGEPDLMGHARESVDLAHVRWASASAITALDLCAATLGRLRCPTWPGNECSLRDFDKGGPNRKAAKDLLARLQDVERDWVMSVLRDQDYRTALRARNPMTHGRLRRVVYGSTKRFPPHEGRTGFPVGPGGDIIDSRPLIELCAALATRHLESFLVMVKKSGG